MNTLLQNLEAVGLNAKALAFIDEALSVRLNELRKVHGLEAVDLGEIEMDKNDVMYLEILQNHIATLIEEVRNETTGGTVTHKD